MEKLLKLINEYHYNNSEVCKYLYDDEAKKVYFRTVLEDEDVDEERIDDERIISKRFGFIKWLVDNDKIDRSKVNFEKIFYKYDGETITDKERILMLLSISDTPIDDLISYLR